MKRVWLILACCLLFGLLIASSSYAQLINYGRRNRFVGNRNASENEEDLPAWALELPKVKTREERRYDINRDGKLQSAEVKVFLRDVIERVEKRSYVNVTSDILRGYDMNKDGVINTYELDKIKEHVQ